LAFETPKSAYQLFQSSVRRALKDEHPELSPHELAKLIADKWAALDPDEKAEYEGRAQRAKNEHREALERLERENPEAYARHMRAVKKREEEAITGGGKKGKKKRDEYDDDPADGTDPDASPPAQLSYFDSIVADLKSKRATKSTLTDEEQKDLEAAFMERMRNAARADEAAAKEGKPALHRLKMLPDVQQQLAKSKVADRMLEDGLLACLCLWLQPEADGSLPNVSLRTVLYRILETLNVNETFLANSHGLGRRLMRYWKSDEETPQNKRVLSALMEKWMRPMLGLSTDFRKMQEVR
jgi:transcription factor SPN1